MQKARNVCYIFIYKKHDTLRYFIFMKICYCHIYIYLKHETFRYSAFLYTTINALCKKQDNLHYVFIYKNLDTLRHVIFYRIFEIGGGWVAFFIKKHCTSRYMLYFKKDALCVTFYIQKALHFALHFYIQKTMHFALNFYI